MKIRKVQISKFRSIENGEFELIDILGIVGQNNSGKTAILKALNSFFNPTLELSNYINLTNLYSTNRAVPRITITFNNINNKSVYLPFITDEQITIKQEYSRRKLDYYVLNNGIFEAASEIFVNTLLSDVQFVLIPTERTSNLIGETDNSILAKLLNSFFAKYTAKRDTLTPKVKSAFEYLQNNALKKVVSGIEGKYLSNKGFHIKIDSAKQISYDLFINHLDIRIIEDEKEFNIKECGSGIQSLIAIAILRYLAELNHTNFIIGIEEPEINLHPQGQKELIYSLLDEVANNNIQIIFSTHSTVLIDQLDHTKIVLVRKVSDTKRKFKSKILQLKINFWTTNNLQRLQYDKFHKFKNSEFFFANHVIVSESSTDSEIFRVLLDNKGVKLERKGISVLELGGIKSLKYAFYLLRDLEIPKTIIVDKDFFFEYQNGSKNLSRYGSGFFNYRNVYKNEPLINEIFKNVVDRNLLEGLLTSNNSRALDISIKYDIIFMKYNLEMDLIASRIAQNLIYIFLNIPAADRNTFYLLSNNENALKGIELLTNVITTLAHKNLPNSYKRLIRRIKDL
ncbi:ATP-dependent nuclease [Flavobacterium sp. LB2P74]|uniref:ATP-dependent nuclease n=1 Tax=Flavobacterium sp. LB2P74 TaxID=3401717 RepID=UPI003AB0E628